MLRTIITCLTLLCLIIPVSGTIITFVPANGSISSLDVMDISESHDGMIAFATPNGLSLYDSDWATIQEKPWDYDTGLKDNYIITAEFDDANYLWLGFSAGIQTYNGIGFKRIGTDEFFSSMDIHDILRDGDTIWIANGNSGLNHFSDGEWKWFRPFTDNGPDAYYITSIAKDYATGNIIVTTRFHGIWKGVDSEEGIIFTEIPFNEEQYGKITGLVDYPFGGVIFFNENYVLHYTESGGISTIIEPESLGYEITRINDVGLTENGIFVIGTNNGLIGYYDGEIVTHITRNTVGVTNNEVSKVFPDSKGRWWFVTRGEAGYYLPDTAQDKIPVTLYADFQKNNPGDPDISSPILVPIHYT